MFGYLDQEAIFELEFIPVFGQGMMKWLDMENNKRKQIALVRKCTLICEIPLISILDFV